MQNIDLLPPKIETLQSDPGKPTAEELKHEAQEKAPGRRRAHKDPSEVQ